MDSSTKIDVEYEVDASEDDLTFQDIPHDSDPGKSKTHEFTNFPHSAVDSEDDEGEEDSAKLLKEDKAPSSSFWTFAYYQEFFDVDTKQVGTRIIGSMLPRPGSSYLVKEIRPKPDLYGPFWICTTLVFTTAIAGNLANYFSSGGKDYHWKYDFHKVTFAATAIYSYWWFIPLILFGVLWWRGKRERFTFLEMICLYGYSLAIYIPISVLWAIQVSWLQWTLVLVGAALSGSVLLINFWPVVSEDNKKIAFGIMAFIFIMHAALAAGFVLYFFYVPAPSQSAAVHNTTVTPLSVQKAVATNPVKGDIHSPTNSVIKNPEDKDKSRAVKESVQDAAGSNKPALDTSNSQNVLDSGKPAPDVLSSDISKPASKMQDSQKDVDSSISGENKNSKHTDGPNEPGSETKKPVGTTIRPNNPAPRSRKSVQSASLSTQREVKDKT